MTIARSLVLISRSIATVIFSCILSMPLTAHSKPGSKGKTNLNSRKKAPAKIQKAEQHPALKAFLEKLEPSPITDLKDALDNLPANETLPKVLDLLEQKKFSQARISSKVLSKDALLGDFGLLLTASCLREESLEKTTHKKYKEAERLANSALLELVQVEARYPHSTLLKRLPEEFALSEVALGESSFGLKKWAQAQLAYDRSFHRLFVGNSQHLIPLYAVEHYAQGCAKAPNEMCLAWIQKLLVGFHKNSAENKVIAELFPELAQKTKPNFGPGKQTIPYRSPDLDQEAFDKAMAAYVEGKTDDAVQQLLKFQDEYPRSAYRYRVRFWLAQALTKKKEKERASRLLEDLYKEAPLTFYGLLAGFGVGKNPKSLFKEEIPLGQAIDHGLQPSELLRLKRAEVLIASESPDFAASELKDLKARDTLSSPFLMYLAMLNQEAGSYQGSFGMVQELINRQYPGVFTDFGLELIFPTPYLEMIQKHSELNKIDPILVLSLIKQESSFDAKAGSGVGAKGLMQLMPATALEVEAGIGQTDLVTAEASIRIGTRYLKQQLTHFGGNIVLALSAYNAGPGATERWVREARPKVGMLEFIELIPYRETREYVAAILRNYFWYSAKLKTEQPKSLTYFFNPYATLKAESESPLPIPVPVQVRVANPEPVPTETE